MENFGKAMRRVFYANPGAGHNKKPSKPVRQFFRRLGQHNLHIQMSDNKGSLSDFKFSFRATAEEIGEHTQEAAYNNGVVLVGALSNSTTYFEGNDVIYAAYFNTSEQCFCMRFAAIPKGKKAKIIFGYENGEYYISIVRKKGWHEIDFEHEKVYSSRLKNGIIVRKTSKMKLPTIDFGNLAWDEEQRMNAANEKWDGVTRTFVSYKGRLYLR